MRHTRPELCNFTAYTDIGRLFGLKQRNFVDEAGKPRGIKISRSIHPNYRVVDGFVADFNLIGLGLFFQLKVGTPDTDILIHRVLCTQAGKVLLADGSQLVTLVFDTDILPGRKIFIIQDGNTSVGIGHFIIHTFHQFRPIGKHLHRTLNQADTQWKRT